MIGERVCDYPKKCEHEEDICYGQDVVLYYEEFGKYGDLIENFDAQNKFEIFQEMFPLWSIKDWCCIPLLDKKEVPPFYDHPESFEVVDENIKYDEDMGVLKQDDGHLHTHSIVCFHPYNTKYDSINKLRDSLAEWAKKYKDIAKISIIENGSWYHPDCDLVIIEQKQDFASVSIYDYQDLSENFTF